MARFSSLAPPRNARIKIAAIALASPAAPAVPTDWATLNPDPAPAFGAALASDPDRPDAPGVLPPAAADPPLVFGQEGFWSWTLGGGVAVGGRDSHAYYNAFASIETFIVDDIQAALELGGWFFDQEAQDAAGASLNLDLRFHILPWEESKDDWSVFIALGAGVLGASDEVPDGSTEFNFTPRAGVGFSLRLGDGPERLTGGVRWQHISNANIEGNRSNDGSDSAMVYLGVTFPF